MICFGLIFMLIAANLAIEYAQTAGFFTTILATALAFLIIFVSKFIYFLIFKFQLRFMFYDNAIIKYKDKEAIFTIENTNEYQKIKEFLHLLNYKYFTNVINNDYKQDIAIKRKKNPKKRIKKD